MKSKTVKFNIFMLFTAIMMFCAYYSNVANLPQWAFVTMSVISMVVSQAITFFSPSGEFVGSGQDWSIGKWISRIGLALLAIGGLMTGSGFAVAIVALVSPLIEIVIRIYGSDTQEQRAASGS